MEAEGVAGMVCGKFSSHQKLKGAKGVTSLRTREKESGKWEEKEEKFVIFYIVSFPRLAYTLLPVSSSPLSLYFSN